MGVNWKGSPAWKVGCRRDVCGIGGGHKGGNECDERGVHNERTVQNHDRLSECGIGFQKAKRAGSVKSSFQRVNLNGQTVEFDVFGMVERGDEGKGLGEKCGRYSSRFL